MITPPYLQQGDKVAIISTARKISSEEIKSAVQKIHSWGLQVELGPHLFFEEHQFAGTDQDRIADLQWAIDNTEIKAIICARGGYGTARIVEHVNFTPLLKAPKWIIGFSDPTVLHCKLSSIQIQSIHGSMPILFGKEGYKEHVDSIFQCIVGNPKALEVSVHTHNKPGSASGNLVGGNLTLLHCSIGTSWEPQWTDSILFFEDLDEYLYHIDRIVLHLSQAGIFQKVKGIVIGHLSDMNDNEIPFGQTPEQIVSSRLCDFKGPIGFGFPIGHLPHNEAVVCGARVHLQVNEAGSRLSYLKE